MHQKLLGDLGIDRRDFLLLCWLLINVFTWLFFLTSLTDQIISTSNIEDKLVIWTTFYTSIVVFSIIGVVLSKRFDSLRFLYYWIAFGAAASLLPVLVNNSTLIFLLVDSALFGASFGLGMPSCLALFAKTTKVENRGRISGVLFFIVTLSVPLLAVPFGGLSLMTQSIICAIWRGMGFGIYFLKPKQCDSPKITHDSFVSVLRNGSFLLFFVPWLLFCVVDEFEFTIIERFLADSNPELLNLMGLVEPVVSTLFVLIAGILCDWIGRKKIVLSGFVALGVAYAILGFFQPTDLSWYLYFVVDGFAWGIFYLTFVLILWADLSKTSSREKYYALGGIPFFMSNIIPFFLSYSVVEQIPLDAAFSLASFFLFAAVMPLVFAPETLPEKKMELRRLRSFAEQAKRAKEKYEQKRKK